MDARFDSWVVHYMHKNENLHNWCCRVEQRGISNTTLHYRYFNSAEKNLLDQPSKNGSGRAMRRHMQWSRVFARLVEQPFIISLDHSSNLPFFFQKHQQQNRKSKNKTCTSLDRSSKLARGERDEDSDRIVFKTRFARLKTHFSLEKYHFLLLSLTKSLNPKP